jgi:hypothetical protein
VKINYYNLANATLWYKGKISTRKDVIPQISRLHHPETTKKIFAVAAKDFLRDIDQKEYNNAVRSAKGMDR